MAHPFSQGDHICAVYETDDDYFAITADYVSDGLRRGERCLYVPQSIAGLARFHIALAGSGIDVDDMLERRALVEASHAEAHLQGGHFDSERMLRMLNDAVETALNDGFVGLRTCGDMSWLLEDAPGSDQVLEYEALLNQFFRSVRACGMCLYDRHRLAPHFIDHALVTHSTSIEARRHRYNPLYRPAETRPGAAERTMP